MYFNSLQYKFPYFSVLQWNQLNSSLATTSSFPKIDPKYLEWEKRKPLIEQVLNKNMASIMFLEEVDQIEFYSKFFEEKKYKVNVY
jgi:mRNA deadenylase 3'-5' endonuclease subunit Ccr4